MNAGMNLRLVIIIAATSAGGSFQFYNYGVVNNAQVILQQWINESYASRGTTSSPKLPSEPALTRSAFRLCTADIPKATFILYYRGTTFSESSRTILWSFTVAVFTLGGLVGAMMTKTLAESAGRQKGILIGAICAVTGTILQGIAYAVSVISSVHESPELLIIGRFTTGVSAGLNCGLVPLYFTEIAPIEARGAAGAAHQIATSFGDMFGLVLTLPVVFGTATLWPLAICFGFIPAALLLCVLPFFPESSRYLLITRRDRAQSRRNLGKIVGSSRLDEEFEKLCSEAAVSSTQQDSGPNFNLFTLFLRRDLRIPTLIAILVMVGQMFTGIAAIFAYSADIFLQAGLDPDQAQYGTVGMGVCYFLCTLPSPILIERLGRRFLLLFQLCGCTLMLILLSVFIYYTDALSFASPNFRLFFIFNKYGYVWSSYGAITTMIVYMMIYGIGSPIPWMIASELFEQRYRSMAVSIGTFTSFSLAFMTSLAYLPFQRAVGPALSFVPFIVVEIFVAGTMAVFLPETKNRSIEDIVKEFRVRRHRMASSLSSSIRRHSSGLDPGTMASDPEKRSLLPKKTEGSEIPKSYSSSCEI